MKVGIFVLSDKIGPEKSLTPAGVNSVAEADSVWIREYRRSEATVTKNAVLIVTFLRIACPLDRMADPQEIQHLVEVPTGADRRRKGRTKHAV